MSEINELSINNIINDIEEIINDIEEFTFIDNIEDTEELDIINDAEEIEEINELTINNDINNIEEIDEFVIINGDNIYLLSFNTINEEESEFKIKFNDNEYISKIIHKVCYVDLSTGNHIILETIYELIKKNLENRNIILEYVDCGEDSYFRVILYNNITGIDLTMKYVIMCYISKAE